MERRPELADHLRFGWTLYWELAGSRALGLGGMGDTPISAFRDLCDLYEIESRTLRRDLWRIARMMDRILRELRKDETKAH